MSKAILTILSVVLTSSLCYAESVQLQTYYPSPYGIYSRLKLVPAPLSSTCAIGSLSVNSTDNNLYYCGNPVAGGGGGVEEQSGGRPKKEQRVLRLRRKSAPSLRRTGLLLRWMRADYQFGGNRGEMHRPFAALRVTPLAFWLLAFG